MLRIFLIMLAAVLAGGTASSGTLDDVRKKGHVVCGLDAQYAGFSIPDQSGTWQGMNVDICKAIAAAIGVEPRFRALGSNERFLALSSGEVDLLNMQNTWTMARDIKLGIRFVATTYYDAQGFLVRKAVGAKSLSELNGASACVISGSTAEVNLADLFKSRGMSYKPVTFKTGQESRLAYGADRCDFIMGDQANLANMRSLQKTPSDHVLLKEIVGREPLGMSVRQGDDQWANVVRYVFFGLLVAELTGVTQTNVEETAAKTADAEAANMLGKTGSFGQDLGLDNAFMVRAIKTTGNYAEIFERHVGPKTPIGLERGLNALWVNGGLQYPPPFK